MITAIVNFKLPADIDAKKAAELFKGSAPKYRGMKGLVRKYYLFDDKSRIGGGVYLWKTRADAEAVYTPQWQDYIADRYGAARASPSFVAYLLITEAVGSSGNSRLSLIDTPEHPQLAVYAVWDKQDLSRLVFLNLANRNASTTADEAEKLAVSVDLSDYVGNTRKGSEVKVKRMTAPGIDSKDSSKVVWAGQSYANGVSEGDEVVELLSSNDTKVSVGGSEGVIVFLR